MTTILEVAAHAKTVAAVKYVASLLYTLDGYTGELPIEYNLLVLRDGRRCYPVALNFSASVAHAANASEIVGVSEIESNAGGCCTVWLDVEEIHRAHASEIGLSWEAVEARLMA